MSLLVNCQAISKSFGAQHLFKDLSLSFHAEEKLGLIGPNGSGKSTLLKLLGDVEQVDDGEIVKRQNLKCTYLPQEEALPENTSIHDILLHSLETEELDEVERYNRVKKWIARAEFQDEDQDISNLSGGWKKRVSIVKALIQEPELLLLDEPTNHLDLEGIIWLEKVLSTSTFSYILVTHDRYFLENCTTKIIEIDKTYPDGFFRVSGNYSDFILEKEHFLENQAQLESSLANKSRRETEWLRRGPKARTSKARYRIDEAYRLKDELNSVKTRNRASGTVGIEFNGTGRKTKRLIEVEGLHKSIGEKLLIDKLDFLLTPGSKLGLMGRNGTGKSTLIGMINQTIEPDGGKITYADDLKIVLFDQTRASLDQTVSLKRAMVPEGDSLIYNGRSIHVASWAKRFRFRADQLEQPVSHLSGGEQARVLISQLMLQPADVLLLDEPTNDLDIDTLEILEESLKDFPGAIILVSHDRALLDRVTHQVIGLDGKGHAGLYADYQQWVKLVTEAEQAETQAPAEKKKKKTDRVRKLSYKEQRELSSIETQLPKLEEEMEVYQQQLCDPAVMNDAEKLTEISRLLHDCQVKVETSYERWEALEEIKALSENG